MTDSHKMLIVAGGTGGHIFPAKAVGLLALERSIDVRCIGTSGDFEKKHLGQDFPLLALKTQGVRGRHVTRQFQALWQMTKAFFKSIQYIRAFNPSVVLCMGGYVTVPVALASFLFRKKIVCHEQNAIAGMSNRYLSKIASVVLEAFPHSFPPSISAKTVGNPVRRGFLNQQLPEQRFSQPRDKFHLLIIGGSQGAQAINHLITSTIAQHTFSKPLHIVHQTGNAHFESVMAAYQALPSHPHCVDVQAFIEDTSAAFANADLIIARSGALTVAEICAVGAAAFFIPFPSAVDDHQYKNAKHLEDAGAAKIFRESEIDQKKLHESISELINDPSKIMTMATQAKQFSKSDSCDQILQACYPYFLKKP